MTEVEKWTIIVTVLGTVATLAAVVVALWQTKYTNKKKLKVTTTKHAQLIENGPSGELTRGDDLLTVQVVNIGNRDVNLTDWGIYFSRKFSIQIINVNDRVFPKKLSIEESTKFQAQWYGVQGSIKENLKQIKKINRKISFYVTDSTGKKYFTKMKIKIKKFIS